MILGTPLQPAKEEKVGKVKVVGNNLLECFPAFNELWLSLAEWGPKKPRPEPRSPRHSTLLVCDMTDGLVQLAALSHKTRVSLHGHRLLSREGVRELSLGSGCVTIHWLHHVHQGSGCVTTHWQQQEHQGSGCVTIRWHHQLHQGSGCHNTLTQARTPRLWLCHNTLTLPRTPRLGLCHHTRIPATTPRLGLCHNTLASARTPRLGQAVLQHTDTSNNAKVRAVFTTQWHQQHVYGVSDFVCFNARCTAKALSERSGTI